MCVHTGENNIASDAHQVALGFSFIHVAPSSFNRTRGAEPQRVSSLLSNFYFFITFLLLYFLFMKKNSQKNKDTEARRRLYAVARRYGLLYIFAVFSPAPTDSPPAPPPPPPPVSSLSPFSNIF